VPAKAATDIENSLSLERAEPHQLTQKVDEALLIGEVALARLRAVAYAIGMAGAMHIGVDVLDDLVVSVGTRTHFNLAATAM
jgi:hypothetical protein